MKFVVCSKNIYKNIYIIHIRNLRLIPVEGGGGSKPKSWY